MRFDVYEAGAVPDQAAPTKDLDAVLGAYDDYLKKRCGEFTVEMNRAIEHFCVEA